MEKTWEYEERLNKAVNNWTMLESLLQTMINDSVFPLFIAAIYHSFIRIVIVFLKSDETV